MTFLILTDVGGAQLLFSSEVKANAGSLRAFAPGATANERSETWVLVPEAHVVCGYKGRVSPLQAILIETH